MKSQATMQTPLADQSAEAAPPKLPSSRIFLGMLGVATWWLLYRYLEVMAQWFTYRLLGFQRGSHLASAIEFFVFEVPKV
ncbi:MAG TPA: hypothetical protein VKP30_06470, partial [Polyangiaceae bacterium]|nr:hypothetical protein [Polyangiaceae bacterium]